MVAFAVILLFAALLLTLARCTLFHNNCWFTFGEYRIATEQEALQSWKQAKHVAPVGLIVKGIARKSPNSPEQFNTQRGVSFYQGWFRRPGYKHRPQCNRIKPLVCLWATSPLLLPDFWRRWGTSSYCLKAVYALLLWNGLLLTFKWGKD